MNEKMLTLKISLIDNLKGLDIGLSGDLKRSKKTKKLKKFQVN